MDDGELEDSGSSRDCSFTNTYFVLPTNLSTIFYIKQKYIYTAPKFLQAIHPGSFSASQTLFSAKSNPHRYPRPFLSLNFHSKVTSIRRNFDSTTVTTPCVPDQPFCGTVWGAFHSVSEDEVKKILNQCTIKMCELDPQPSSFLAHCLDDLLPHLTSIINDSLHSGLFLSASKSVIVKPLLKKTTLNLEILKKTTDQCQISPSCPKPLRKLISASSRTIC